MGKDKKKELKEEKKGIENGQANSSFNSHSSWGGGSTGEEKQLRRDEPFDYW